MNGPQAVRGLLIRGMLAGLAAGLLMFAFAKLFGEPAIDKAIAFEGPSGEKPLVSRALQSTLGLLTGTVVYGVAFGGIFALVFAAVYGRVGHAPPRRTAGVLALIAFTVIILVPFLKYPSNPPAVGADDTIGYRTQIYFAMLAISVAAAIAALRVHKGGYGTLAAAGAYLVLVTIGMLLMPGLNEIPPNFPADVLWDFRVATLGTHAVLYATLGLGFGALAERWLSGTAGAAGTYRTASLSARAPHS